jgi:hypothetical protein
MEIFVFAIVVFAVAVYGIWRVRRGSSPGLERHVEGLPDDQRDKDVGLMGMPNRGRPWGRGN